MAVTHESVASSLVPVNLLLTPAAYESARIQGVTCVGQPTAELPANSDYSELTVIMRRGRRDVHFKDEQPPTYIDATALNEAGSNPPLVSASDIDPTRLIEVQVRGWWPDQLSERFAAAARREALLAARREAVPILGATAVAAGASLAGALKSPGLTIPAILFGMVTASGFTYYRGRRAAILASPAHLTGLSSPTQF